MKQLIFEGVIRATLDGIFVSVPFLKIPVIRQITESIVYAVASQLFKEIDRRFNFLAIDRQVKEQKEEYQTAIEELETILAEGSPGEIENAKEEVREAVRRFVRLN